MKNPFSNWFRSSPTPPITGAMLRPVRINPGEAQMIRAMTDLSSQMTRDVADYNRAQFSQKNRSYDAAGTDQYNTDFKGTYGNANAEIFTYNYKVRARTRTLAKDTPHGKAIVRTYQNNVVGSDPFALTMRVGSEQEQPHPETGKAVTVFVAEKKTNKQIAAEWKKFCKPKNFTIRKTISFMEAMGQVEAAAVTTGSVLIRKWPGFPGNKYRFAIDLLETDRLQETYNGFNSETGNPIRASVEYHKIWNYPVAYWILARHPGEFVSTVYPGPGVSQGQVMRNRVDAKFIIHYNNLRDRAEQDWGFTELDSAVRSMHHNFQYARALTLASVASCCKPFVIEKDFPTGLQYTPTPEELQGLISSGASAGGGADEVGTDNQIKPGDPVKLQQGNIKFNQGMSPAMTQVMEWGFKMKVLDPKFPIEAAHEFRNDNLKDVATATGISYSALTGDFQSLGYIAAQMSKQPERDQFMKHQRNITEVVLEDIFAEWLESSILADVFDFPISRIEEFCDAANFKAKRWPFTDMLREVQALVLKLDAGLISPQQAQDEMPDGISIEDVIAQRAEFRELCLAHGLPDPEFAPTQVKAQEDVTPTPAEGGPPATQKPGTKKGSVTAGAQTTATSLATNRGHRGRGDIPPNIQKLLDEENINNGVGH